jgi:hypothetical protein
MDEHSTEGLWVVGFEALDNKFNGSIVLDVVSKMTPKLEESNVPYSPKKNLSYQTESLQFR